MACNSDYAKLGTVLEATNTTSLALALHGTWRLPSPKNRVLSEKLKFPREIQPIIWNHKVHYLNYNSSPLFPYQSQLHPVRILSSCFFDQLCYQSMNTSSKPSLHTSPQKPCMPFFSLWCMPHEGAQT